MLCQTHNRANGTRKWTAGSSAADIAETSPCEATAEGFRSNARRPVGHEASATTAGHELASTRGMPYALPRQLPRRHTAAGGDFQDLACSRLRDNRPNGSYWRANLLSL